MTLDELDELITRIDRVLADDAPVDPYRHPYDWTARRSLLGCLWNWIKR